MIIMRSPLVALLDLAPHPEGGWYRQTWRAPLAIDPPGYGGPRAAATAIYFLLHADERSRWHVVRSSEIWLWHAGGPLALHYGGTGESPTLEVTITVGPDVAAGQQPQAVIPAGVWQAAEPLSEEPVLVSCVVAPGFEFADFRMAD
jgi:predicted cupin superfamily sugar epimerase